MEFRDLGPLSVTFDGAPTRLSGTRLLTALAVLLVHQQPVSEDRLIDAVWGDQLPQRAGAALDTLIFRLRQVLEPGRTRRDGWLVLRTAAAGYQLVTDDSAVDSRAFAVEAEDAAAALAAGTPDRAMVVADRALDRWKGPAYGGVPGGGWLDPVCSRLDELRVGTAEVRVRALLELGRPEQAVSSVQPWVLLHPFREPLWAHWALGLYRAGRQAAALDVLAQARQVLDEELGVSPGPALTALQAAILQQSPELLGPASTPIVLSTLPTARRILHGRDNDVVTISSLLTPGTITSITGPVGVGKTSLALAVARAARQHDGVHFVDLTQASGPDEVVPLVTSALELRADGADVMEVVHRHLQGRDLLLVLDNCEHVLDAVAELVAKLPGSTTVLTTSREPLDLVQEQEHRLSPLAPAPAPADPAIQIFLDAVGTLTGPADLGLISQICAAVDGLPLGIELAARRARTYTLHEVLLSVRQDPGALRAGRREHRTGRSLADEIDTSVRLCEEYEQVLHRRLSVLSPPFTLTAAQAVAHDSSRPPTGAVDVMDALAGLARRSLIVAERPAAGKPTRFRQLVPIRHHAAAALAAAAGDPAARRRTAWVTDLALSIPQRGRPGQRAGYDRIEADLATVAATVEHLLNGDDAAAAAQVVMALAGWAYDRNRLPVIRRWLQTTVNRTDLDPLTRALVEGTLGSILEITRDLTTAHELFDRSVPVLIDSAEPAAAAVLVDIATTAWVGDDWAYGSEIGLIARDRCADAGLTYELRIAESAVTAARLFTGPPQDALAAAEELLAEPDTSENGRAVLMLCATTGVAAILSGRPDAGLRWTERSLRVAHDLGVRNMGETLEQRGNHLAAAGRYADSARCFGASATQYENVGLSWPRHDGTSATVDQLRTALPPGDFDRAWASGRRLIEAGDGVRLIDWI